MDVSPSHLTLALITALLTIVRIVRLFYKRRFPFDSYLGYTWLFFVCFLVAQFFSFGVAIWLMALISFRALREYLSLIDIRLQDRWAIFGAYFAIPFMYYFIMIDWYGMFIVSIPVYAFLAVPLLVAIGGRTTEGTVFSVGAIDFGLFLFVFCIGHIGYLLLFSPWMAALLVISVLLCDAAACLVARRVSSRWGRPALTYLVAAPLTLAASRAVAPWTEIPAWHSAVLALMIPLLVIMGRRAGGYIERDLGIEEDLLVPGRGQILRNLQSLFYAAPVMFHYIRYFLK